MSQVDNVPDIEEVTPRGASDDALFAELAAVLKRHDALDRFGVSLLHRHVPLHATKARLEVTHVRTKAQALQPTSCGAEDAIETQWRLTEDGRPIPIRLCRADEASRLHGRGHHGGDNGDHDS